MCADPLLRQLSFILNACLSFLTQAGPQLYQFGMLRLCQACEGLEGCMRGADHLANKEASRHKTKVAHIENDRFEELRQMHAAFQQI